MEKKKQNEVVDPRTSTEEQPPESQSNYMKEWTEICQAYCNKVGAELLFVNLSDFGCEMPNGELRHIDANELAELLGIDQSIDLEDASGPELKMF